MAGLKKDRTIAHSRMVIWDGKGSALRMSQTATMVFGHKAHPGGKGLLCPNLRVNLGGEGAGVRTGTCSIRIDFSSPTSTEQAGGHD